MNIHPIFVHFPVALLTVYSIIKILPLRKWLPRFSWGSIEFVVLFVGVLGAFAALTTGEIAEHLVRTATNGYLIEMHSTVATFTTFIYLILFVGEILENFGSYIIAKVPSLDKVITYLSKVLANIWLMRLLALLGLGAVTLTGLLGGVIVYGFGVDPFADYVVKFLGISI